MVWKISQLWKKDNLRGKNLKNFTILGSWLIYHYVRSNGLLKYRLYHKTSVNLQWNDVPLERCLTVLTVFNTIHWHRWSDYRFVSTKRQSRFQKLRSIWSAPRKKDHLGASINYSGCSLHTYSETVFELERMRIIKPELGFSFFVVWFRHERHLVSGLVDELTNITDVSFPCVCPVIDHEIRHNIIWLPKCIRGLL